MAIGFQTIVRTTKRGKVTGIDYANQAIVISYNKRFNSWTVGTDHYAPQHVAQMFKMIESRMCANYVNGRIEHTEAGRVLMHDGRKQA